MTGSFGPWTTAIDSGSRAQLSAFWKKRLARLPGLRDVSPRISKTGWLLLLAAVVVAMSWPTLYLSQSMAATAASGQPSEPADEPAQAADEPKPQATPPGGPILVSLPGGVTGELIGLCDHTAKNKSWWAPDGTPIAAPYQRFRSRATPSPGQIAREIAVVFHIPESADITAYWRTDCSAYAGGRPEDAEGKPLPEIDAAAVCISSGQPTARITFNVAAGEWKTMAKTDGRNYRARGTREHGYAFTKALQNNGSLVITISHDVLRRDLRIVAVDQAGKIITTGDGGGGGMRHFMQTTAVFHGLKREDVQEFRLQARPWHRIEVRDVVLHQGQHTKPTVVDLGEENEETERE